MATSAAAVKERHSTIILLLSYSNIHFYVYTVNRVDYGSSAASGDGSLRLIMTASTFLAEDQILRAQKSSLIAYVQHSMFTIAF